MSEQKQIQGKLRPIFHFGHNEYEMSMGHHDREDWELPLLFIEWELFVGNINVIKKA